MDEPWVEAAISIDGVHLTQGEAMTVRVALGALSVALGQPYPNETREETERSAFYRERAQHVLNIITSSIARQTGRKGL